MMSKKDKTTFTTYEARTHLSKLLKRVRAGEELYISHGKEPIAKLVPLYAAAQPRVAGSAQGGFVMSDDFDAPLPKDLLAQFYK